MVENKTLLPHHVQQTLCTSRLPYRQGRKLTAVKVYTVTTESSHLLIFGVPSLNLYQETKTLFMKFGKILKFNISNEHATEPFTETYHAQYAKIQSARIAKKMLDTKNFYGGCLHVCYAPEFETIDEIRQKLLQRQRDVLFRLKNLERDKDTNINETKDPTPMECNNEIIKNVRKTLNMGQVNTFTVGDEIVIHKKRKLQKNTVKPCFLGHGSAETNLPRSYTNVKGIKYNEQQINSIEIKSHVTKKCVEVIDCTSVNEEVITNINETLNYNKFGNEVIRKIPEKPLNKITFNMNKKSLIYAMLLILNSTSTTSILLKPIIKLVLVIVSIQHTLFIQCVLPIKY